ncbi:dual specificity protein phosphatase family protein [Aeromicrobium sp.]|uniref:dual specificity protein phosphatase family protein n=1 Tax=Aeromicrobium sp. TaxID=1871063 RepID=UPI004033D4F2
MNARLRHANAHEITEHLWIGGDLDTRNPSLARVQLDEIVHARITTIVDVRLEWDDQDWVAARAPHIAYHWLGVDDAGQRMPDSWFDEGVAFALEAVQSGGNVLVHCHMGINRGPSMGLAAMLALGWEPLTALDRIRSQRPIAYIGYAEDAIDWWLRRKGATTEERHAHVGQVRRWRRDNHLDVAGIIRTIRSDESA